MFLRFTYKTPRGLSPGRLGLTLPAMQGRGIVPQKGNRAMDSTKRREFLKHASALAAGLSAGLACSPALEAGEGEKQNDGPRFRYLGWQTGLS